MATDVQCLDTSIIRNGTFFHDGQVQFLIRIFPIQVSLITLLQASLNFLLKPFGTSQVVAQILGGILVGPTFFSSNEHFRNTIFPDLNTTNPDSENSLHIAGTLGFFGCMLHVFLIGVKLDLRNLIRSSKKERVIGVLTTIIPLLLTMPFCGILSKAKALEDANLPVIAGLLNASSFHTVSTLLTELKILNTELGRLATSTSTISGMICAVTVAITVAVHQFKDDSVSKSECILFVFATIAEILFIAFVLRKVVLWMIERTPQGEPIKEIYLFITFLMILGTGLMSEVIGNHVFLGPMLLGFVIPDGPPLGSALVDKLDPFVSGLLLPIFFFNIGAKVYLNESHINYWGLIILFSLLSIIGKFMGTIIPCIIYEIPFRDAFTLGLILNMVGTFEIQFYVAGLSDIKHQLFSIIIICVMVQAAVIAPLVRFLYNPSRRYVVYKNRNIENAKEKAELRILACIYNEDNVPSIVNILEASNPTRDSPIAVYPLHLIELMGRSTPLLISHKPHGKLNHEPSPSEHIINCFNIYEKQNQGAVFVQPFTSFTPFMSAHDDIFTIAIDKLTSFIIIPFHKQWNIDGTTQNCKWGNTNKKVLKHAPCSVGILIDRRVSNGSRPILSTRSRYNVGVIFLGDADDREALYFAMRMAQNPNVYVTVHRIILVGTVINNVSDKNLDGNVINEYRLNYTSRERNHYKEVGVKDGVEIISLLRTMDEYCYDLILVGRSHYNYSTVFSRLSEWVEYPELGFFGDLFASSDFQGNTSVLVLQQHSCEQQNASLDMEL